MREPFDAIVPGPPEVEPEELAAAREVAPPRRPPGGKMLLRLLELLDHRGLTETAEATIDATVAEESREEFSRVAEQFRIREFQLNSAISLISCYTPPHGGKSDVPMPQMP
jgi:hypothetical protein